MLELKQITEKIAKITFDMRQILNTADKEKRGLNTEENSQYEDMDRDLDDLIDQRNQVDQAFLYHWFDL